MPQRRVEVVFMAFYLFNQVFFIIDIPCIWIYTVDCQIKRIRFSMSIHLTEKV